MGKLNLTAQELQALYTPTSRSFENTVQNTLHNLSEGKGQPVMKRTISAALVIALILILLTISAAIALNSSDLLSYLFGHQKVPQDVAEIVSRPELTVTTPDVKVLLNEYLFDGEKLYLHWSMASLSDKQVMVTMDPFIFLGKEISVESVTPLQTSVHGWGQILGGEADGAVMPKVADYYGTYVSMFNDTDQNVSRTFQKGETLTLNSRVYVWELLSSPDLAMSNPSTPKMEQTHAGYLDIDSLHGMPTNRMGLCGLGWLLLNDHALDVYDAEKNQHTYEENGWAKIMYEQPVQFTVTLDTNGIRQVKPNQKSFITDNLTLEIRRLAYMPTGGTLVLRVRPNPMSTLLNKNGSLECDFAVLNADSKEVLSDHTSGVVSTSGMGMKQDYIEFYIILKPVADNDMPKTLLIVPIVPNPAWNQIITNIYPDASSPNSVDSLYTFVMKDSVRVELMEQP